MKTNNNDIKKEVSGITLKESKNNELSTKNTPLGITPNHLQTNNDDIRPRFRKCKELGCDKMYDCQEKLDVQFTNRGWTMDYYCPKKGVYVYYE